MNSSGFGARLCEAVRAADSAVVVGVDAHLDRLPGPPARGAEEAAERVVAYFSEVLELVRPYACATKLQLAFFEALGAPGWSAYQALLACSRRLGYLVIADAKRGDIGSTAAAYARAHLAAELLPGVPNPQRADALTVNPFLGGDSLAPFLELAGREGAGLFVLLKTSNPGSADLQDLVLARGEPVFAALARLLVRWAGPPDASGYGALGAVVGATHAGLGQVLRPLLPGIPVLLPGYGEQGGDAAALAGWFDADGLGAVVPASRSLSLAGAGRSEWRGAVVEAAKAMRDAVNRARRPR